jgi:hypothetical protein
MTILIEIGPNLSITIGAICIAVIVTYRRS